MKPLLLSIVGIFLLAGCSTPQVEYFSTPVERLPLSLPHPPPVDMEQVDWHVITRETAEEKFAELEALGFDPVLIGLTDEGFEADQTNRSKLGSHINQLNVTLDEYRAYYEPPKLNQLEGDGPE